MEDIKPLVAPDVPQKGDPIFRVILFDGMRSLLTRGKNKEFIKTYVANKASPYQIYKDFRINVT
jgi:hypothetical protein